MDLDYGTNGGRSNERIVNGQEIKNIELHE